MLLFKEPFEKVEWLKESLANFLSQDENKAQILIFANKVDTIEELERELAGQYREVGLACIHGERN